MTDDELQRIVLGSWRTAVGELQAAGFKILRPVHEDDIRPGDIAWNAGPYDEGQPYVEVPEKRISPSSDTGAGDE